MSDDFKLRIQLPLPLDIAGAVMQAIGKVYPGTTIRTEDELPGPRHMVFNITADDRENADSRLDDLDGDLEADPDDGLTAGAQLLSIGDGCAAFTLPDWIQQLLIPLFESAFAEYPTAENYLEIPVRTEDGRTWSVCILRPNGSTPHELRTQAEARADRAEARVAELEAQLAAQA